MFYYHLTLTQRPNIYIDIDMLSCCVAISSAILQANMLLQSTTALDSNYSKYTQNANSPLGFYYSNWSKNTDGNQLYSIIKHTFDFLCDCIESKYPLSSYQTTPTFLKCSSSPQSEWQMNQSIVRQQTACNCHPS